MFRTSTPMVRFGYGIRQSNVEECMLMKMDDLYIGRLTIKMGRCDRVSLRFRADSRRKSPIVNAS